MEETKEKAKIYPKCVPKVLSVSYSSNESFLYIVMQVYFLYIKLYILILCMQVVTPSICLRCLVYVPAISCHSYIYLCMYPKD